MTMYYTPYGGERTEIPAEHEKVLALYRDSMPLVWEIQEYGPPRLYELIHDEDPEGVPTASRLEDLARRTAAAMHKDRLAHGAARPPQLEALMYAALRARLTGEYQWAGALGCESGVDVGKLRETAVKATTNEAERIARAMKRIVGEVIADQAPHVLGDKTPEEVTA